MPTIAARVTRNQQMAYCPTTDVTGDTWQLTKRGTTTGAGTVTSLVDTGGDSGGADTYNGRYWIRMTSGAASKRWARIVDDDGSGTLTLESPGLPAAPGSGSDYEIWSSPDPVVVVDSSSGETDMVDAVRADEANDFWNGYYACPITGNHRGKIAQITDFVKSTGTFTLASSFGSALAAGDVVLLRKFIEVGDVSDGTTNDYYARPSYRLDGSRGDGSVGARGGTVGFSTQIYGSGTAAAAGSIATKSVLGDMFRACGFYESIGTSQDVAAGSGVGGSGTELKVDAAQWEYSPIGNMVAHNCVAAFVESITDAGASPDSVQVTPTLPVAPAENDTLYASRAYRLNRRGTDGDYRSLIIEWEVDGIRTTMTGCRGNVTFTDGTPPTLGWEFQVDHFIRELNPAPYIASGAYTTVEPIQSHDRRCYLSTTGVDITGITASLGNEVVPKPVQGAIGINGRAGYAHANTSPGMSFREIIDAADSLEADDRWHLRTSKDIIIVYGSSEANMFAIRIPVGRIVEDPKHADEGGIQGAPNVIRAHDASTVSCTTDDATSAVTIYKIPDFSFHIW